MSCGIESGAPSRSFPNSALLSGKTKGSWKKGRPRKGDQRGTKPRSRPLAPIGGSSATHFRVITQCINETHRCFDSRFSMSELGQAARCCLSAAFLAGSPDGANGSRECAPGDERNCARTVMTGSACPPFTDDVLETWWAQRYALLPHPTDPGSLRRSGYAAAGLKQFGDFGQNADRRFAGDRRLRGTGLR
jgi:hypothetical protein